MAEEIKKKCEQTDIGYSANKFVHIELKEKSSGIFRFMLLYDAMVNVVTKKKKRI